MMRSRGLSLVCAFLLASGLPAQVPAPAQVEAPRLKVGATTLLGIPMIGVERPLRRARRSFQWDVMISPWRSIDGYPFEFVIGTGEWRFYRRETRDGWYSALHVGAAAFRLRRPDYADTTLYQEGASLLAGGSVGRVWRLRSGWTVDAYFGGGTVQSLYKGYDRITGNRYDGARRWNVGGEWLPYRAGLALGLPLGLPRR